MEMRPRFSAVFTRALRLSLALIRWWRAMLRASATIANRAARVVFYPVDSLTLDREKIRGHSAEMFSHGYSDPKGFSTHGCVVLRANFRFTTRANVRSTNATMRFFITGR